MTAPLSEQDMARILDGLIEAFEDHREAENQLQEFRRTRARPQVINGRRFDNLAELAEYNAKVAAYEQELAVLTETQNRHAMRRDELAAEVTAFLPESCSVVHVRNGIAYEISNQGQEGVSVHRLG